ncbi:telomere-protecting terminal protein Tpg (plasmid) [Streptomyces sp. BI20]|uniref:telomere-protecting terminal protein Tpg n=1 Tax=Streptomyces sp. BI20 TaxID=3403460 RepID=UPI003C793126
MDLIGDGLEKAVEAAFTRPIPKSAGARVRFLVRSLKSTREVAAVLGISRRTVERYVRDQIHTPKPDLAARLEREVRARWQPLVRKRARDRAASVSGIVVETRARFGFTAAPGSSDDARTRLITQALPPLWAGRLFDARAAGADEGELRQIVAEALGEVYFRDGGSRAAGLGVEFTDIDYVELEL